MIGALWFRAEAFGVRILGWFGCSPVLASQLIRFGVVGAAAAAFYVGTMALVVDVFGGSIVSGAVAAFIAGTIVSYAGNALWSFQSRPTIGNAVKFVAITLAGLIINVAIAWICERLGAGYLLVSVIVMTTVPIFNFVGHRLVTFGGSKSSS